MDDMNIETQGLHSAVACRLLLIEEKNKLVEELKRHQQSADSEERIRDLEEDLYKVKEIFKKDIQLDNQRSQMFFTRSYLVPIIRYIHLFVYLNNLVFSLNDMYQKIL